VKKILEFIEKEIEPIEDEMERHLTFNRYLGRLPEEELVIYAIYKDIWIVPAIYKYYTPFLIYTLEDLKWDKQETNKYLIFPKMANILTSKSHNKS